jgi:hypothetical protein
MPPTTIVDDEVPEPPAAVAVADGELLQAVAVSAAAPMATANWIVRMRLLDKVFPFRWFALFGKCAGFCFVQ